MSSVVGDRAVAQATRYPGAMGAIDASAATTAATTAGAMRAIGTVEYPVKIKRLDTYDAPFIRVHYFSFCT